jgi:hypothetical protein
MNVFFDIRDTLKTQLEGKKVSQYIFEIFYPPPPPPQLNGRHTKWTAQRPASKKKTETTYSTWMLEYLDARVGPIRGVLKRLQN